jgi:hypothetical protein
MMFLLPTAASSEPLSASVGTSDQRTAQTLQGSLHGVLGVLGAELSGAGTYLHEAGHVGAASALAPNAKQSMTVVNWDNMKALADNPQQLSAWADAFAMGDDTGAAGWAYTNLYGEKSPLYDWLKETLGTGGPRAFVSAGGALATIALDVVLVGAASATTAKLESEKKKVAELSRRARKDPAAKGELAKAKARVMRYRKAAGALWGFTAAHYLGPVAYASSAFSSDLPGHDFKSIASKLDIHPAVTIAALAIPPALLASTWILKHKKDARRRQEHITRIALTRLGMRGALPKEQLAQVAPELRQKLETLSEKLSRAVEADPIDVKTITALGRQLKKTQQQYLRALARQFAPQIASEERVIVHALQGHQSRFERALRAQKQAPLSAKQKARRLGVTAALALGIGGAMSLIGPEYGAFGGITTLLASSGANKQLLADVARKMGIAKQQPEPTAVPENADREKQQKTKPKTSLGKLARGAKRTVHAIGDVIKQTPVLWNIPIGLSIFGLGVLEKDATLMSAGATYTVLGVKTGAYGTAVTLFERLEDLRADAKPKPARSSIAYKKTAGQRIAGSARQGWKQLKAGVGRAKDQTSRTLRQIAPKRR